MMKMSDYKGWRLGVTTWEDAEGQWGARVEAWEPGKRPHTDVGVHLPFARKAASEPEILKLAKQHGENWIDGQNGGPR